jgi:heme/copper-type cytochrome/quinol oxidase subunit 1
MKNSIPLIEFSEVLVPFQICKRTKIAFAFFHNLAFFLSVSGLNFVLTSARASGRSSIVSMSLGGSASTSLDNAVASVS